MKRSELRSIIRESIKNVLFKINEGKLTEARKLSSSDKKAIAKVVDDAELSFMRLSSSETWMDDYSTEDMVKILVTKYNSSEYRKTSLRDLLDAYDVKKQKDNIYGWKDEMSEGKLTEGNNFNMVSAKFKDALDDASEISTDSVKKLIKKFKEKRPDAAMEYAKQSFGWMFKEGKVNEASDRFLIKKLTDTFSKFKLSRKHEIMMDSSYGAGSKIPVLRPKGGFGDGAMIDYDGEPYPDGKIVLMSSKSGRPIPGESEFNDIDKAMVAATEYVDNIKESSAADLSSYSLINKTLKHTR